MRAAAVLPKWQSEVATIHRRWNDWFTNNPRKRKGNWSVFSWPVCLFYIPQSMCSLHCNQSWLGHEFAFSCASGSLLGFTMSSHRLLELPPSHLIGCRDYYGFNLQHLIEMRTKVFCLFFFLFFYLKEIIIIGVLNMNCFSHKFSECPKSWSQRQVGDKYNVTFWFSFSSFYSYFSLTI